MSDLAPLDAEKIARVRGHLEGYDRALRLNLQPDRSVVARLHDSLREDAATLATVLEPEEQPEDQPEEGGRWAQQ